jgi:hypothetical protein
MKIFSSGVWDTRRFIEKYMPQMLTYSNFLSFSLHKVDRVQASSKKLIFLLQYNETLAFRTTTEFFYDVNEIFEMEPKFEI